MRTPAGTECPFFYGDYYRGRNREECRLLPGPGAEKRWSRDLCKTCPIPEIARANSCEFQELDLRVKRSLLGQRRATLLGVHCHKCECQVADPHIGCGQCHAALPNFQIGE